MERDPRDVRPRGLPGDTNVLFHNNGDGTFTDVTEKAGILKPGPRYSITAVSTISITTDAGSLCGRGFRAEHPLSEQPRRTFTDVAMIAGCAYNENGHEQAGWA